MPRYGVTFSIQLDLDVEASSAEEAEFRANAVALELVKAANQEDNWFDAKFTLSECVCVDGFATGEE